MDFVKASGLSHSGRGFRFDPSLVSSGGLL